MFEAKCSRQIGKRKKMIFHQMFLCLHEEEEGEKEKKNTEKKGLLFVCSKTKKLKTKAASTLGFRLFITLSLIHI